VSYERLTIIGHIGSAEAKKSPSGNPYVRLSVAVDRGTKENRKTVWYTVLLFGGLAERAQAMLPYYAKGRLVLVEGRPQSEIYVRNDGTHEIDHALIASTMPELLDYKNK
jgi:single-stranded DNA-binding protein